jgi:Zn ribbon nucleic-acid-binding protein
MPQDIHIENVDIEILVNQVYYLNQVIDLADVKKNEDMRSFLDGLSMMLSTVLDNYRVSDVQGAYTGKCHSCNKRVFWEWNREVVECAECGAPNIRHLSYKEMEWKDAQKAG